MKGQKHKPKFEIRTLIISPDCLSIRFVGVASPPVQCSKTGLKKRDMKCWVVAMCARSYSPVPLFLCLTVPALQASKKFFYSLVFLAENIFWLCLRREAGRGRKNVSAVTTSLALKPRRAAADHHPTRASPILQTGFSWSSFH